MKGRGERGERKRKGKMETVKEGKEGGVTGIGRRGGGRVLDRVGKRERQEVLVDEGKEKEEKWSNEDGIREIDR